MPNIRPRAFAPDRASPPIPASTEDYTLDGNGGLESNRPPREPSQPEQAQPPKVADGIAKIIALIPAESTAAYQTIYNLTDNGRHTFLFTPLVWLIIIGTPLWNLYATHQKGEPLALEQAIVSVPAFFVWLVALQSPFLHLPQDWQPSDGGAVLVIGTFVLPLVAWGLKILIDAGRGRRRRAQ